VGAGVGVPGGASGFLGPGGDDGWHALSNTSRILNRNTFMTRSSSDLAVEGVAVFRGNLYACAWCKQLALELDMSRN